MLQKNNDSIGNNIEGIIRVVSSKIFDKTEQIRLIIAAMLSDGHVLIEDRPGLGKTTLALALSQVFGMSFKRIQFTSDMMPSDVLGVSIYDREKQEFSYHKGPVFTQFLLADELNRATPKTQSALLEAMAEKQVSIDGGSYQLDSAFFVVATQNPLDEAGTYNLPDSQLDRFMLSVNLGYPKKNSERKLYSGEFIKNHKELLDPLADVEQILQWKEQVKDVYANDEVIDYLQQLVYKTREHPKITVGLSPRAGLALFRVSQSLAFLDSREFMTPSDIQNAFPAVCGHRLISSDQSNHPVGHIIQDIIDGTPIL